MELNTSGTTPAAGENNPEASPASQVTEPDNTDKSGVQERINTLTKKRRQAERDAAYWRGQAEAKAQAIAPAPETKPQTPKAEDLNPDDFDSNADYLKAFAKATRTEIRTEAAREEANRKTAESQVKINKSYSKGREAHEDLWKAHRPPLQQAAVLRATAAPRYCDRIDHECGHFLDSGRRPLLF